jgi:hypothetical protein
MIYVIGIVEMCERFAYYGTTAVCTYKQRSIRLTSTDLEQSSTLFSSLCLLLDLSHQLVPQARMANLVLWAWANKLLLDSCSSTNSSPMLCPWSVSNRLSCWYGQY